MQQQAAIDQFTVRIAERGEVGTAWLRHTAQQRFCNGWHRRSGHAHYADAGSAGRAGNRDNGVGDCGVVRHEETLNEHSRDGYPIAAVKWLALDDSGDLADILAIDVVCDPPLLAQAYQAVHRVIQAKA